MLTYSHYTLYLFAYLLGSIPFGLLFVKMAGGGDLRDQGSGNIGTTNVFRTGHKTIAVATFIADALKGALPVLAAYYLWGGVSDAMIFAGAAAILGHIFPLWLGFKGGKGVATTFGVYFVLNSPIALVSLVTWLVVLKRSKISSLSALIALFVAPVCMFLECLLVYIVVADNLSAVLFDYLGHMLLFMILVYLLILWTHRKNIKRLMSGNES